MAVVRQAHQERIIMASARRTGIRQRARDALGKLEGCIDKPNIRPDVRVRFIADEPSLDWDHEGLDSHTADDRLIATILCQDQEVIIPIRSDSAA